jgi:hypothetical protein
MPGNISSTKYNTGAGFLGTFSIFYLIRLFALPCIKVYHEKHSGPLFVQLRMFIYVFHYTSYYLG